MFEKEDTEGVRGRRGRGNDVNTIHIHEIKYKSNSFVMSITQKAKACTTVPGAHHTASTVVITVTFLSSCLVFIISHKLLTSP